MVSKKTAEWIYSYQSGGFSVVFEHVLNLVLVHCPKAGVAERVFLEISQNSQEKPVPESFLIKLQA